MIGNRMIAVRGCVVHNLLNNCLAKKYRAALHSEIRGSPDKQVRAAENLFTLCRFR